MLHVFDYSNTAYVWENKIKILKELPEESSSRPNELYKEFVLSVFGVGEAIWETRARTSRPNSWEDIEDFTITYK